MVQIGRKIYYELNTGNVIWDMGERQGDVVATTQAQDFQNIAALQAYQQSAVGAIQLNFGDFAANFAQYPFHVDITQTPPAIVWDTAATTVVATAQQQKMAQLRDMYQQTLDAGFDVAIGSATYTFGWTTDDKANMGLLQQSIDKGLASFPILYADVSGSPVSIPDQATLTEIETKANTFAFAQHQQILTLVGQARAATTVAEVNAVQWTSATY